MVGYLHVNSIVFSQIQHGIPGPLITLISCRQMAYITYLQVSHEGKISTNDVGIMKRETFDDMRAKV